MYSNKKKMQTLTESEAEIMNVVWDKYPTTIRDIFDVIKIKRNVAYTTIATTVKILTDKHFLSSKKTEKSHIFTPMINKKEYTLFATRTLINKFFDGMTSGLVMNLLSDGELSAVEKESIKKMFEGEL